MYHTAGSVCTVVKAAINRLTEMPTRIALSKQSAPKVVVAQGTTTSRINTVKATASPNVLPPSAENDDANPISTSSQAQSLRKQPRQLPTFRSSILRDLKKGADSTVETERMVTDDIRASPRLLGYLFSMMAGAVMLVSVVQFYRQRSILPVLEEKNTTVNLDKYFYFYNGVVYRWKLWGAIYMSSAGVALSLVSVLVHFDTVVAPKIWLSLFRDGSLAERNWILLLILFWAAAVYICTSTLSVGESQANVFFTTWIAFGSVAMNYGVWRESAGLPSLLAFNKVENGGYYRETTHNWMWICMFSIIFAGSATDIYINRSDIVLRYRGQPLALVNQDWIIILSVVWSEVALCLMAIVFNEYFHTLSSSSCRLPCVVSRPAGKGRYRCVFGWRQFEGFILVVATGCKFWVILEYAAVDGVIPGLSNAYFGVWGSFFNGVFALGTWLHENKNIQYIVREESGTENREQRSSSRDEA